MKLELKDKDLYQNKCYIDGKWVGAESGQTIDVLNPATGDIVGAVSNAGAIETQKAIDAAEGAGKKWRTLTANARSKILKKWAALQTEHIDDLAQILTAEQGKPLAEAKGEIMGGISYVEWMAEECKRIYGDLTPPPNNGQRMITMKQPVGVCAMITPWNFPSSMITRKAAPALAAGCTVILKPSELTPFSALALAELAERAGVPKGVLNVVVGDAPPIGKVLTESPIVRKFSFTGSTAVGKKLMAQCAPTVKKVSLELGGNAPFIVFDDADLDAAVAGAIGSKFRNSGQTCICANRLFVQAGIYDAFAKKLKAELEQMTVGLGTEKDVDFGPVINEAGLEKVEAHIEDAVNKGAEIITGGKRHVLGHGFFQPTVVTGATPDMQCFREETFGPFAPLFKFKTDDEVIALANDTEYGLAGYFYSQNMSRIWRVAEELEYGMVGVNTTAVVTAATPFGGWKQSGIGCEGSKYGIDEYLEMKLVAMGGI